MNGFTDNKVVTFVTAFEGECRIIFQLREHIKLSFVCMSVCIYVCMFSCTSMCACKYGCAYANLSLYMCIQLFRFVYKYVSLYYYTPFNGPHTLASSTDHCAFTPIVFAYFSIICLSMP